MLNKYRDEFLQITDLLRMTKEFEMANELLKVTKNITKETEKDIMQIINAEEEFIKNNDTSRHNLREVFEKNN